MAIQRKHRSLLRVGVIVAVVVAAKIAVHAAGWEVISINPLFSGVVAANVFLMGFLLSGVLADFKESERLPGELAVSLENLAQEVRGIRMARADADVGPCLRLVAEIGRETLAWFHKRIGTVELLERLNDLTPQLAAMEAWTQATLVARLKQEQSNLRRVVVRIDTIRETAFVSSGYLLADVITVFLCAGLLFAKMKPLYESLFFVTIIAYFMIYLLTLIRDLDNPFGYYESASDEDVSLEPLEAAADRLNEAGLVATTILRSGTPAEEIVAVARERGADCVVIGTRGHTGLARLILGSVARNVLHHAPCSVLVVREKAEIHPIGV